MKIDYYLTYIHWVGRFGFGILCYLLGGLLILVGLDVAIISVDMLLKIWICPFKGLNGFWSIDLLFVILILGGVLYLLYRNHLG